MIILSSLKSIYPRGEWMFLPSSTLKLTWPIYASFIAYWILLLSIKVPNLVLGINPLGPNTLANGFNKEIVSWVA